MGDVCLPQAGFMPKYDQKRNSLVGALGSWQLQGRSCLIPEECRTGLFVASPFFRDPLSQWGFDKTGMGLSGSSSSSVSELDVPTKQ